jgi:splicing factor 3B subunit 3
LFIESRVLIPGIRSWQSVLLINASQLYQIENLGDDDTEQREFQSLEANGMDGEMLYSARGLRNLGLVDEMDSLMPLIDAAVANLTNEDSPQIYALCGKGARSSFRILKHGLRVTEIAGSDLPANPNAVWTVRGSMEDEYDSYIIISFVNATLVLSIGDSVEEVTDTGVLTSTPTISMGQLGEDSLVQIYPAGIRHIRADKRVSEWRVPKGTFIVAGTSNYKQVSIALSNAEIIYFELDSLGNLNEFQDRKSMSSDISSIAMSPIPEGRQRASFLVIFV